VEFGDLIEFRYRDGRVVSGDYASYAERRLNRGDRLEFDELVWVMYDREDRGGVTVYLCRPAV
jgi:hypothetical protein